MAITFDDKRAAGLESFKVLWELAQVRVKGTEGYGQDVLGLCFRPSKEPRTASGSRCRNGPE